ncbi:hypothetical protein CIB48_g8013 [Xylaria polymorpha]|nr:hypothetical protein CIB48_g8013 [Xylaria polymorpha]
MDAAALLRIPMSTCDRASSVRETLGSPLSVGPPPAFTPPRGRHRAKDPAVLRWSDFRYWLPCGSVFARRPTPLQPETTAVQQAVIVRPVVFPTYGFKRAHCGTGNSTAGIASQPSSYTLPRQADASEDAASANHPRIRGAADTRATNCAFPRVDYYSNDRAGLQNGTMHGKKHPAKNSHSQSWGSWSDWKWSQNEGRFYCERLDWQGQVEYRWENGAIITNEHQRTPRTEATIDQLTAGLGGLDVNSSGYDHNRDITYPAQTGSPVNHSTPDNPASPLYTHDAFYDDNHGYSPSHSHSYRDKGKGISNSASHDIHYNEGHSPLGSVPPVTNSYSQHDYPERSILGQEDYERATSNSYYPQPGDHDSTDYELEQALKLSRDELLGNSRTGGSSTSGAHYDPGSIYPGTYDLNPIGPGDNNETTPRGTPIPTRSDFIDAPSSDFVDPSIIRGTPGSVEPIDHQHSYKFQPGEVFKILWSEPTGQVIGDSPISDIRAMNDSGGQFYVGYRRFIIGVRPSKHGIIYAAGQKPKLLRNEPELGFDPVPLEIYAEGETLARESRVNYSKLVTIEHNVKVFFIGRIPYPYFDSVSYAVDKCWNDKMQKPSKKSRR